MLSGDIFRASRLYRCNRGFTLMEMLVTMVLFAAVSTLVWQALGTLTRLESRLSDSRLFVSEQALRSEWVRQALRGLMNGPQGDPLQFSGDATSLRGYTSMPPWPGTSGPARLELLLVAEERDEMSLVARRSLRAPEWSLWFWQGEASFSYLDRKSVWHRQWPPLLGEHPTLPVAIRLRGIPGGELLVAMLAGNNPMLRRVDLESP